MVSEILTDLESNNSRLYKENVLEQNKDNDELKLVLKAIRLRFNLYLFWDQKNLAALTGSQVKSIHLSYIVYWAVDFFVGTTRFTTILSRWMSLPTRGPISLTQ